MQRDVFEDDHRLFQAAVREFTIQVIRPESAAHRAQHEIPRYVWEEAGKRGYLGLGVPEEYGGSGVDDFRFNAILVEELAAVGLAYASALSLQVDIAVPYFVRYGTHPQKERWLPDLATGQAIVAIAMTEPMAGSDLRAIRTAAKRQDNGWILNGAKTFITNGSSADVVVVAARTSPQKGKRGLTLFAVPSTSPGFARTRSLDKIGQHEAGTAELFFDDVRLEDDQVIGEVDEGFPQLMEQLPQERLSSAIGNLAHAQAALEETVVYANQREVFGRTVSDYQHNRFKLAHWKASLDVTRAFVDKCLAEHVAHNLDPVDAAIAKWWSSDVQNSVIDGCVQLFGGYGYMSEYPVARAWADARVTKVWAGTNEIMMEIVSRSMNPDK